MNFQTPLWVCSSVFRVQLSVKWVIHQLFLTNEIFLLKFFFFNVDHFLKYFLEFITILLLFYDLAFWPQGMWNHSSPTRGRTHTHWWSLNHRTAGEVRTHEVLRGRQSGCSAPGMGDEVSKLAWVPACLPGYQSSLGTREARVLSALNWPVSQII